MSPNEYETAVPAFIRNNGITRCPTACAPPTRASVPAVYRAAAENYAAKRERLRERRIASWRRSFRTYVVSALAGE
jgi:hypothetical protein